MKSSNRSRMRERVYAVLFDQGRPRPSTARTNPARTVSASSFGRIARPRRLEPEGGPDRERDAPRPGRVVGRGDQPETHLEPAVVLEDEARRARR